MQGPRTVSVAGQHPLEGRQVEKGRRRPRESKGSCALGCVQMRIRAGECHGFMRRVIKMISKRLVELMVQVNCMK